MFMPNTTGLLSRHTGRNQYSEPAFAAPIAVPCAVVDTLHKVQKTPVRADSSASRGASEEQLAAYKVLFPKTVSIGINDKFQIDGLTLRVIGITPRRSVLGMLDHFDVDFDIHP
jgi:hypothetical protein